MPVIVFGTGVGELNGLIGAQGKEIEAAIVISGTLASCAVSYEIVRRVHRSRCP